jgi:hypothetical protein
MFFKRRVAQEQALPSPSVATIDDEGFSAVVGLPKNPSR